MNQSDSERIAAVLESIGNKSASSIDEADLIVINACSVRQSAIDRIWGQVSKFKKLKTTNHKLRTILTGCVLKNDKRQFSKNFDLIFDIKDLPKLPKILEAEENIISENYLKIEPDYSNNFTAQVPIMTGCNNFCTFCVVPYTRGREISRPAEEIICEIKNLIERGHKEIWLLGQNVNSYHSEQKTENKEQKITFPKLLRMVNDISGNFWIRFTSSHPKDFSDGLIKAMKNCDKVTEYLNLPIQSGDDAVLRRMNRPYTIEQYKYLVNKVKKEIPNICLSTDVIVGFPDEQEYQFQNTIKLFEEIKYDMAYISQYSPRAGTQANKFKDDISHREKKRRWKLLSDILRKTALEKNEVYVGKNIEVLPDGYESGFLTGKSRSYKTVKFKGPKNLIGQFIKVKVLEALPWRLRGKLIK